MNDAMISHLILDPRPELPGTDEWDKLLRRASPALYRRLWTVRSAGAVIGNGRIERGIWTQEEWEEIAKPRLKEYAGEIKKLMEGKG